jgi:sodium/bile acid cotransporter 7
MARPKLLPDNFTLCLVSTVVLASLLPVHGQAAVGFNWLTNFAVGLLFFLHGAKLSREAIVAGATHWRLHLVVLLSTFALFPLLGLALKPLLSPLVTPALYAGVLFLCTLPSTVQSSIAFTSIAKGNVPAAVCSASASSLLGIFITPALVSLVVTNQAAGGTSAWHTVWNIVLQLLVPFVAGQLLRPVIGKWIERNRGVLKFVDQGSILLVVYGAFSEAVNEGLWRHTSLGALGGLVVINVVLLALALSVTMFASKRLGEQRERGLERRARRSSNQPLITENRPVVEIHDGLEDGGQITPGDQILDAGRGESRGRAKGHGSGPKGWTVDLSAAPPIN